MSKYTDDRVSFDAETNERLERLEAATLGDRCADATPTKRRKHKARLAQGLRERLLTSGSLDHLSRKGINVPELLAGQSDDEIVRAHIQCPRCLVLHLPLALAGQLIAASHHAEGWLIRIADASHSRGGHRCTDGKNHCIGYRALGGGAL